jgi:hypothetical protein
MHVLTAMDTLGLHRLSLENHSYCGDEADGKAPAVGAASPATTDTGICARFTRIAYRSSRHGQW